MEIRGAKALKYSWRLPLAANYRWVAPCMNIRGIQTAINYAKRTTSQRGHEPSFLFWPIVAI